MNGVPKDADSVCTRIFLSLVAERVRGNSAPNIILHLDNTASQNKNRYMLAFCECLVHWNFAKSVAVKFLVVGHTANYVDRFFALAMSSYKKKSTESLPLMVERMAKDARSKPTECARFQ